MLVCDSCRHGATSAGSRTYGLFLDAAGASAGSAGGARDACDRGPSAREPPSAAELARSSRRLAPLDPGGAPVALAMGYRAPPGASNCLSVGVANGVRGAVIGAGFGAVFALASPPPGAGAAVAAHVGQAAMRNAGGFAAWTALYSFTRCELVKMRRKSDILNPAIAGFVTGAALSLATMPRAYWRHSSQQIIQNAGGSAIIAVVFDIANRV